MYPTGESQAVRLSCQALLSTDVRVCKRHVWFVHGHSRKTHGEVVEGGQHLTSQTWALNGHSNHARRTPALQNQLQATEFFPVGKYRGVADWLWHENILLSCKLKASNGRNVKWKEKSRWPCALRVARWREGRGERVLHPCAQNPASESTVVGPYWQRLL